MYMTKPKQVQKKLSENTGKTFSVIMPPFTSRRGGIITEMTVESLRIYSYFYLFKLLGIGILAKLYKWPHYRRYLKYVYFCVGEEEFYDNRYILHTQ